MYICNLVPLTLAMQMVQGNLNPSEATNWSVAHGLILHYM